MMFLLYERKEQEGIIATGCITIPILLESFAYSIAKWESVNKPNKVKGYVYAGKEYEVADYIDDEWRTIAQIKQDEQKEFLREGIANNSNS